MEGDKIKFKFSRETESVESRTGDMIKPNCIEDMECVSEICSIKRGIDVGSTDVRSLDASGGVVTDGWSCSSGCRVQPTSF